MPVISWQRESLLTEITSTSQRMQGCKGLEVISLLSWHTVKACLPAEMVHSDYHFIIKLIPGIHRLRAKAD